MGKNNKEEFKLNQLVMAQVRGYPWWPGYIGGRQPDGAYKVVFFGDFSYAPLNEKKIKQFDPRMKKLEKNRKELQRALKSATRVHRGDTTIKQEFDAVNKKRPMPTAIVVPVVLEPTKGSKKTARPRKKKSLKKKTGKAKSKTNGEPKKRGRGRVKKKATPRLKAKRGLEIVNIPLDPSNGMVREQRAEQALNQSGFWGEESDEGKRSADIKMSFPRKTAGIDGFRSVTAKGVEPNLFDSLAETHSVRFLVDSLKEKIPVPATSRGGSEIAILDQTKGSLGSIENMKNMIRQSGQLAGEGLVLEELAQSPSISRKGTFQMAANSSEVSHNIRLRFSFRQIEQEMIGLIEAMKGSQGVSIVEQKLKAWFGEMVDAQDFSSIVGTRIGEYLMQMKSLCQEKIQERQQYSAILQEIKNFKKIIITKISHNFFSPEAIEEESGLESLVDRLPSHHNPSPLSKDPTALRIFGRRVAHVGDKFHLNSVMSPNLNNTTLRNSKSFEGGFRLPQQRPSEIRDKLGPQKFTDLDSTFAGTRKGTELDISLGNVKTTFGPVLDTPSVSTIVNKSQRKCPRPLQIIKPAPWIWKHHIDKKVMRCVGKKIAKALFRNQGENCLSSEKAERLGKICEELVGKEVLSCVDYQTRVMGLLKKIQNGGAGFLKEFIFQKNGNCSVKELRRRLRNTLMLGN